jgi:hypothetical protein
MSKFNKNVENTKVIKTENLSGGEAFETNAKYKLTSLLLTSFIKDQFYRTEKEQITEIGNILKSLDDKKFAAKAAIFARTEFGMRSITHVLASELSEYASSQYWAKSFYEKIVFRPDDMSEIISYLWNNKKTKKLPNALKKGFAKSFDKFDNYQLAKYRMNGKEVSLVDIVNLVHPIPIDKNREALHSLVKDTLRNTKTWEAMLTNAGKVAETEDEKVELKKDVWKELLESKKIGYLALLRNIKNIIEQSPELVDLLCDRLQDSDWITNPKNTVLPFQYLIAYKQFQHKQGSVAKKILIALSNALEISCSNVPKFTGETLVVVDNSGSMQSPVSSSKYVHCSELGAIFGAVLAKATGADIMEFGSDARYINFNPADSVMSFASSFAENNEVGHDTDFHSIFKKANRKYDRIFIFSDMACNYGGSFEEFKKYRKNYSANPFLYGFDLHGYGTTQFTEDNIIMFSGFSEKIFDLIDINEKDKYSLINSIEKVEL